MCAYRCVRRNWASIPQIVIYEVVTWHPDRNQAKQIHHFATYALAHVKLTQKLWNQHFFRVWKVVLGLVRFWCVINCALLEVFFWVIRILLVVIVKECFEVLIGITVLAACNYHFVMNSVMWYGIQICSDIHIASEF